MRPAPRRRPGGSSHPPGLAVSQLGLEGSSSSPGDQISCYIRVRRWSRGIAYDETWRKGLSLHRFGSRGALPLRPSQCQPTAALKRRPLMNFLYKKHGQLKKAVHQAVMTVHTAKEAFLARRPPRPYITHLSRSNMGVWARPESPNRSQKASAVCTQLRRVPLKMSNPRLFRSILAEQRRPCQTSTTKPARETPKTDPAHARLVDL